MKREHFCRAVYILGRVSWYLGCSAFRLSTVERCAAPRRAAPLLLSGIAAGNGIDRSIPSCLVVRDFPREEKGTLTRQYIPLKLFRNGRGIKRTAGRGATLNYYPRGYGKIIAANDESVPAISHIVFFLTFLSSPLPSYIISVLRFYPDE